jgi:signal transduction histidine kinase
VDEILRTFDADSRAANVRIERQFQPAPVVANVDAVLFREAITNLVRNGIEAMAGGGVLTVSVAMPTDGGEALVTLEDTGHGLQGKELRELLRPFYTTKEGGTGLGLSVVQKVVALHGGTLDCWDSPEGGAVFRIGVPVTAQEHA